MSATSPAAVKPSTSTAKRRVQGFDYIKADEPLVARAFAGMKTGEYRNATDAARALAKDAKGVGMERSRATRLIGRIQSRSAPEQD